MSTPFPTLDEFNFYLGLQKDRKKKSYNLVKLYRYDIPDDKLSLNNIRILMNKNKFVKLVRQDGLSRYQFEEWQKIHKKQNNIVRHTFKFPEIGERKWDKNSAWLIFKYKDILGELKIDVDITNTTNRSEPHYKIDMLRISAARNKRKHGRAITTFKTYKGVTASESGEPVILMAILGKLFGDIFGPENIDRLHWHGTLSDYWIRKPGGKCWQIPELCEEYYGSPTVHSREEQIARNKGKCLRLFLLKSVKVCEQTLKILIECINLIQKYYIYGLKIF